jgi:prevent-host-death family protein
MARWQTEDAENNFADMIAAAEGNGPQVVMRHKDPVAVVLSPDDYRRLVRQADANFAHLNDHRPVVQPDHQPRRLSWSSHPLRWPARPPPQDP